MKRTSTRLSIVVLAAGWLVASAAAADWLVTTAGDRIETDGPWQVKGRTVVFTLPGGTLSSIRLSEIDLEASESATRAAVEVEPEASPPAPAARREPVLRLTNREVGEGEPGVEGAEVVVERLRQGHGYKDVSYLMNLVNWEDTPQPIRDFIETQFEWMVERRIRDVRLAEITDDDPLEQIQDGVTYTPNVDVTHRLTVDFVPDPDADERTLDLYVGTVAGSYYIAAARPIEE